jgi:hypothetical protein
MSVITDNIVVINIAQDYTDTPGFRYRKQGSFSGEEFREKYLEPYFKDPSDIRKIRVIFDGTAGYPTSFLEEAFGGLVRIYGYTNTTRRLEFVSDEDAVLIADIKKYMREATA